MKTTALNMLTFPLRGSSLIEAGAGTGKTYTIAQLYTRLVLGHGTGDTPFPRPLEPREILVVTFGEAATMELRDRIRRRLAEAARFFSLPDDQHSPDDDPNLTALRDSMTPRERDDAPGRLTRAAESMDDGAIYTIHGWCLRTLRRYSFESGLGFSRETADDTLDFLVDAVKDYWRSTFYGLPRDAAEVLTMVCSGPGQLRRDIQPLLNTDRFIPRYGDRPRVVPDDIVKALEEASATVQRCRSLAAQARTIWKDDRDTMHRTLRELRPGMNGSTYRGINDDDTFDSWLNQIDTWSHGGSDRNTEPAILGKLRSSRLKLKKGVTPPEHPFFEALEEWMTFRDAIDLKPLETDLVLHAARNVRERFARAKRTAGVLDFNDMLTSLRNALDPGTGGRGYGPGDGPGGAEKRASASYLARSIRREFPVVLVDEFQDTDEVQYAIFDSVYGVGRNDPETGLFLIGDPKQAIYRFRGADIYSYLKARTATEGRHYSLTTNYRSTRELVEATNHLFTAADRHPRGPFLFGSGPDSAVPFHPAKPRTTEETLVLDGANASPITIWTMPEVEETISSGQFRTIIADKTGDTIARWLRNNETAHFRNGDEERPVTPRDIAILVRTGTEAQAILEALRRRGIAGVYLSARDSVFSSPEATHVYQWLQAILDPENESALRTALATATIGMDLAELERIAEDQQEQEIHRNRFAEYRQKIHQEGVLPALRALMGDYRLSASLLSRHDAGDDGGERVLTNVLHLAEWLHQKSADVENIHDLLRHLALHMEDPGEEQLLRLERDDQCVRVVTIFKAKGLQYEIVMAPFLCAPGKHVEFSNGPITWHHPEAGRVIEFNPDEAPDASAAMERELLSEEMRLFYVALTRARFATVFTAAPVFWKKKDYGVHRTGVGYMLSGGEAIADNADLQLRLNALLAGSSGITVEPVALDPADSDPAGTELASPEPAPDTFHARTPERAFREWWWIASYTALRVHHDDPDTREAHLPEPENPAQSVAAEEEPVLPGEMLYPRAASEEEFAAVHVFPAGAAPGTFIHGVLEETARHGFSIIAGNPEARRTLVDRACARRGWDSWATVMDQWLERILLTPFVSARFGARALVLGELGLDPSMAYQAEMEFLFEVRNTSVDSLDRIVRAAILPGMERPALHPQVMNGMFKGFIDLVFRNGERYYLADWKSNRLGPDNGAYTGDAIQEAILEKRYDLQFMLYTLALHRHLKARLPDYNYDRHIGGGLYFFLRGFSAAGNGLFEYRADRHAVEELDTLVRGNR